MGDQVTGLDVCIDVHLGSRAEVTARLRHVRLALGSGRPAATS
jgi:hypothetical protein